MTDIDPITDRLDRLLSLLERLVPAPRETPSFDGASAFLWDGEAEQFISIKDVNRIDLSLLKGIDHVRDILLTNTRRFAAGLPANNALLWGSRGMGKSSLVKAAHAEVQKEFGGLKLVEIHREDISTLPRLLGVLRGRSERFLLFCDDLSFEASETDYKSLKGALEGGVEGRPRNTILYATSNRRHLVPRDMLENERATAVTPGEGVEEKVSLSDRFGLWLGFHACSQDDYLAMVRSYAATFGISIDQRELDQRAVAWATTRGARSGRVAWQFTIDLAAERGVPIDQLNAGPD